MIEVGTNGDVLRRSLRYETHELSKLYHMKIKCLWSLYGLNSITAISTKLYFNGVYQIVDLFDNPLCAVMSRIDSVEQMNLLLVSLEI